MSLSNVISLSVFIFCLLKYVESIRCYECYLVEHSDYKPGNVTQNLCKDFDSSEKFVKECGNSSFCRKTILSAILSHPLVGIQRGCATQLELYQQYENGIWNKSFTVVENAYNEGCAVSESYGLRTVKIEECFCTTDFCNSGRNNISSFIVVLFCVAVLVLVNRWQLNCLLWRKIILMDSVCMRSVKQRRERKETIVCITLEQIITVRSWTCSLLEMVSRLEETAKSHCIELLK